MIFRKTIDSREQRLGVERGQISYDQQESRINNSKSFSNAT